MFVVDAAGEIYGDVPNIAARVQALAQPGMVLVTVRVLFVAEERGSHKIKGGLANSEAPRMETPPSHSWPPAFVH